MQNILYILTFLIFIPLNSCATLITNKGYSPSIEFSNLSNKKITNLDCNWAGVIHTNAFKILPGVSKSESYYLRNLNNFYGTVHLTWENEAGKKFEKTFEFSENDLPIEDIKNHKALLHEAAKNKDYSNPKLSLFVKFEFTQDGVEFYTSHSPGAWERAKKSGKIMNQIELDLDKKK
jgi:hypothetical protein